MARFPVFTDAHVRGPFINALRRRGWKVVRWIDVFPEDTVDEVLFEHAAKQGMVFVTNDKGIHAIAHRWLREERTSFRMIYWWAEHQRKMSDGDVVRGLEAIANKSDAFSYPIEYIKPTE